MLAEYLRETVKNPALLLGSLNEHRAYLKGRYGFRPSTTVVRELLAGRLRPLPGAPYAAIAAVRDRLPEARAEAGLRPLSGRPRKGGVS